MGSFDAESNVLLDKDHALAMDKADSLRHLRDEFIFPTKENLKAKTLPRPGWYAPVGAEAS